MKITGVRMAQSDSELVELDLMTDVYFIDREKNVLVYHTRHGDYFQIVTLELAEKWLRNYGFMRFDRFSLINVNLIKEIDAGHMKVVFNDNKKTSISEDGLKIVWNNKKLKNLIKPISRQ